MRETLSGRPILVTGGAGFIGCNLVDRLARDGHDVIVMDVLARPGVERNLSWLESRHGSRVQSVIADVRDRDAVAATASAVDAVFHFAAQVAVTTSLVDPREDFDVNLQGTLNLLETLRVANPAAPVVFASTNKVYGNLAHVDLAHESMRYVPADADLRARGISEACPLSFSTPYGCSKGAADQYVLDYAHSFGLRAAVFRMSCIYGPHQMGTEDQGWVAHFVLRALAGEAVSIFGDGDQVRDILFVEDAVEAYLAAWRRIDQVSGRAYNLGGGVDNAVSLNELLAFIEMRLGRPVARDVGPWRAGDQRYYVSDIARARDELGLAAPRGWRDGVDALIGWLRANSRSGAASREAETV